MQPTRMCNDHFGGVKSCGGENTATQQLLAVDANDLMDVDGSSSLRVGGGSMNAAASVCTPTFRQSDEEHLSFSHFICPKFCSVASATVGYSTHISTGMDKVKPFKCPTCVADRDSHILLCRLQVRQSKVKNEIVDCPCGANIRLPFPKLVPPCSFSPNVGQLSDRAHVVVNAARVGDR